MSEKITCEALIEGGQASAGPPIGPTLGGTGVNLLQIVQKINEKTQNYEGLKVPVKITVDTTSKEFEISVGTPPTSALLLNAAKAEKGSGTVGADYAGDLSMDQIIRIAKSKQENVTAASLKATIKTVLGTARSCGLKVDGQPVKEVMDALDEGKYQDLLKE